MHTALLLTSTILVVLGGYLALFGLRRVGGWHRRRAMHLAILAAPLLSLALGIGGLYHFAGRACLLGAPRWDITLMIALPLTMGVVALGALGLGVVRLVLLDRVVRRSGFAPPPEMVALLERLLPGQRPPGLLLCVLDRPLALVCGFGRPTVLVSTWLVEHLDHHEFQAMLAHELAHVVRRDYAAVWLATLLRDAFWYLPTSWVAYRHLQHEKELACDDLAVGATARPLALASALAKVWHGTASGAPHLAGAQYLAGDDSPLEERIARLLTRPVPTAAMNGRQSRAIGLVVSGTALASLLVFEAANIAVMLAALGCGPAATAGRWL